MYIFIYGWIAAKRFDEPRISLTLSHSLAQLVGNYTKKNALIISFISFFLLEANKPSHNTRIFPLEWRKAFLL